MGFIQEFGLGPERYETKKKKLFFVGYGVLGYAHLTYNFGFRVANEWREPIRKPQWFPPIRWLKPFRD